MKIYTDGAKTGSWLGDYIRDLRIASGMTINEVSDEAGYDQSYLSHVENNQQLPSKEFVKEIFNILCQ